MTAAGPLAGVRVLDLSRLYPGAFCTSLLADLGADVVKVESPGIGDGLRMMTPDPFKAGHVALNRGKRSLALDLKAPGALDVVRRLVDRTDVVVESHRPGALDQLGIGYAALSTRNPGLVWCALTAFGSTGPLAHAPGHDITFTGYAGVLGLLAEDGTPPPVPQITLALQTGALAAVAGITSALVQRARTGRGLFVDAALTDAAMWTISEDIARAANAPAPGWPALASRGVYRCADDRYVTVAASEPKPWAALCAALDLPELAAHRIGIDEANAIAALTARLATRPAAHWLVTPGLAGGVGPVHTPAELLDDPHVVARDGLVTIDGTDTRVLGGPLRLHDAAGTPAASAATAPPPEIGEHTDEVLAEAGFTADDRAALRAAGVI